MVVKDLRGTRRRGVVAGQGPQPLEDAADPDALVGDIVEHRGWIAGLGERSIASDDPGNATDHPDRRNTATVQGDDEELVR